MRSRCCLVLGLVAGLMAGCHSGGPTIKAGSNPWFTAATSGSAADLDAAVKSGADVNAHESRDRNTPLHTAAMAGNVDAVRFIIAHGAAIDAVDEDGRTALMMCLHNSRDAAAVVLVEAGANLEVADRTRNTALMFAARRGQVGAIKAMVARKVVLDAQNSNGKSALHFAAEHGQIDAARELVSAGASAKVRDTRGRTPIDWAITKNRPEIVRILRAE